MHRRGYLALVGSSITVGLAGCGGTDEPDDGTTPGAGEPGGGTATGDETTPDAGGETTTTQTGEGTSETQTTGTETATTEATTAGTTGTQTAETEQTTAAGDVSTVTIEGSILADGGLGAGVGKHVEMTITNEGNAASGRLTVTVRWYDENGALVATSNETVQRVDAGDSAVATVYADDIGVDADAVADYDVTLDERA